MSFIIKEVLLITFGVLIPLIINQFTDLFNIGVSVILTVSFSILIAILSFTDDDFWVGLSVISYVAINIIVLLVYSELNFNEQKIFASTILVNISFLIVVFLINSLLCNLNYIIINKTKRKYIKSLKYTHLIDVNYLMELIKTTPMKKLNEVRSLPALMESIDLIDGVTLTRSEREDFNLAIRAVLSEIKSLNTDNREDQNAVNKEVALSIIKEINESGN